MVWTYQPSRQASSAPYSGETPDAREMCFPRPLLRGRSYSTHPWLCAVRWCLTLNAPSIHNFRSRMRRSCHYVAETVKEDAVVPAGRLGELGAVPLHSGL